MRNMIGRPLGRVMVVTIGTKNPSDAEWGEMLDLGRRLHEEAGHDPARSGGVVFTDGGAPSSAQRQKVRSLYGDQPPAMALVTDSVVARGAAAIFKVFWPSNNHVFVPTDWEKAFRHAGLAPGQEAEVAKLLRSMQREVGELSVLEPFLSKAGLPSP